MIKIIDYKAGNAPSVMHAIKHMGYKAEFARQAQDLNNATHIILPGVGSAKATMDSLISMDMPAKLEEMVLNKKIPFLGICVGMQILFEHSQEDNYKCLSWLKGHVEKYDTTKVRVPQMGWNLVRFTSQSPIKTQKDGHFYFVNSYHAKPENKADIWALSDYNGGFVAGIRQGNVYGTQFHVEKSGEAGLSLLEGFLGLEREV
ncbi:MAG: imidazole glycerol phosphate synthase subunit HisH [Defluviitaleaceae bacterium]|nr:imidazole glycerol phosphate synthase subunit HisH [Defluviitaleaceae bacterium]